MSSCQKCEEKAHATGMYSLSHKVALVTGVTRRQGIGAAIALELARAGADVCTAYYRPYDREMPWGVEDTEPEDMLVALREVPVYARRASKSTSGIRRGRVRCSISRGSNSVASISS